MRSYEGSQVQQDFLLMVGPCPSHSLSSSSGLITPQRIKEKNIRGPKKKQDNKSLARKINELRGLLGVPILFNKKWKSRILYHISK